MFEHYVAVSKLAVVMPGNKRWHLELKDKAILLFRDDKEVCHRNGNAVGPIKECFLRLRAQTSSQI